MVVGHLSSNEFPPSRQMTRGKGLNLTLTKLDKQFHFTDKDLRSIWINYLSKLIGRKTEQEPDWFGSQFNVISIPVMESEWEWGLIWSVQVK